MRSKAVHLALTRRVLLWRITILLLFLAHIGCRVAQAQQCPIQIQEVTRVPLATDVGAYGSALRILLHNSSGFVIRGIELGITSTSADTHLARPAAVISNHTLRPDAVDTLIWNSTRYERKNAAKSDFALWPALIVFGDGSKWVGKYGECEYRSEGAGRPIKPTEPAARAIPTADPSNTLQQLQQRIDNGQATLVDVVSTPDGANVDVDMKFMGHTPLRMVLLKNPNGKPRNVVVYKSGYTMFERDVTPTGGSLTINAHLVSLANSIH